MTVTRYYNDSKLPAWTKTSKFVLDGRETGLLVIMADKRTVDELSIEELERILAIKKREARQRQLQRMRKNGRVIENQPPVAPVVPLEPAPNPASVLPAATVTGQATNKRKAPPRFEDDVEPSDYADPNPERDQIWRKFLDRTLLLVEAAAVVGLVVIGVMLVSAVGELEKETEAAQRTADELRREGIPTLEPTPQISLSQFVLPGGHTPPIGENGGQFNFDEVPQHLRGLVQEQILNPTIQRPPVTAETALVLMIPKINVNHTIVQGVDWEALKQGIGQLPNGTDPTDDNGNLVLAAHNDIYGEIFRHLDQLEPGDQFQIQTQTQIYTYTITGWEIVEPDDAHVMDHTENPTATLISCYPYQIDTHRIVVFAEREDV